MDAGLLVLADGLAHALDRRRLVVVVVLAAAAVAGIPGHVVLPR
jgi:hypothetical protein